MEEYAYILDYLAYGRDGDTRFKRESVAYAVGENEFKLFELIPRPGARFRSGDRVYIGKDTELRKDILHVRRRISCRELTSSAQNELPFIVQEIVSSNRKRFTRFFNEAQPVTTKFHTLELLPGLGKKTMWAILNERKKSPFKDLDDLARRVPLLKQVENLIVQRILLELRDPTQKYRVFVAK